MTLAVKLTADASNYTRTLRDAEKTADTVAGNIGSRMQSIGGSMMGVGAGMTAGLTAPIAAGMVGISNSASNLEQSIGGVESVFGDAQETIFAFGETADQAVGLSERSFNDLSTVTGSLLQNLGFDATGAADEMVSLAERGADVAATFGGPVDAVLQAVNSGLKGEFNPLEQFGVKMNAAAITARALEMGLGDANGVVDDAGKAQAALAIFYEQTARTQGQFAREAETAAGQEERLTAQMENASAELGTNLLPLKVKLLGYVSDLVGKFQALTPTQQKWLLGILGIVAVIGPAIMVIGGLITAIGTITTFLSGPALAAAAPFIGVIAAIAAVVALLYFAWTNNWGGIQEKTQSVITAVTAFIQNGLAAIQAFWQAHGAQIMSVVLGLWMQVQVIWQAGVAFIQAIFATFKAAFEGDWYAFGENLRAVFETAWQLIVTVVTLAWGNLKIAFKTITDNAVAWFKGIDWASVGKNIIQGIANGLKNAGGILRDAAINAAKAAFEAAKGFLGINSPSTLFEQQIGRNMALGLNIGFERNLMPLQMGGMELAPAMASVSARTSASMPVASAGKRGSGQSSNADNRLLDALEEFNQRLRSFPTDLARANESTFQKIVGRSR